MDRTRKMDYYLSTTRAFVFMDGEPYVCADLPQSGVPHVGPVSVTWGSVQYHSGAGDEPFNKIFTNYFAQTINSVEAHARIDKMAFTSNVAAPEWDFNRFPCLSNFQ